MAIYKWEVYCTTESSYIHGYLDDTSDTPSMCFNNNSHSIDSSKIKIIEKISSHHTNTVSHWKLFCDTEQAYVYGYSDISPYPEVCFNNKDHVVSKLPILLHSIKNNFMETSITEETPTTESTDGRFRCVGLEISATQNTSTRKDFSWPYPVSGLILRFTSEEIHRGDYINCYGRPVTNLNNLSTDITSNTSILPVNSTTTFVVGMSIVITDSINTESLGKILSKSSQDSTITVQTPTQFSYYKNAYIGYFNPAGTVTSAVSAGDIKIICSYNVIQNVKRGMVLYINDSTNSERLGEVFQVNKTTNEITIQNSPDNAYSAGSYISIQLHMIKDYKLGPPADHIIGSGKIGGSYTSKFHVISIEYKNNSVSTTKDFNWYTEILY